MASTALALVRALTLVLDGIDAPSVQTASVPVLVSLTDHPDDNAAFPAVVLDSHEVTQDTDAYDAPENTHTLELVVWSQYRGSRQVLAILGEMFDRLHGQRLALEDGQCLSCRVSRQLTTREPDGITYRGHMTLTIITADEDD